MSILTGCLSFLNVLAQSEFDNLVWSDEFDYAGVPDPVRWNYDIGGNGWGNHELQFYTSRSENVRVSDGSLIIIALLENYDDRNYTSARVTTRAKADWKYCRVEIRAKLPEGRGTWPALWMMPSDGVYGGWPASGEIDIMEHVGYDMGTVYGTIHTEAYNGADGTQRGGSIYFADVHTDFHVYAIEWDEDSIRFFADDQNYFTYPNYGTGYDRWPFDQRFYLLMNIAIGGDWGGQEGVDNSIFPQTLEIDYVRIYEKFQQQEIIGPTEVESGQQNVLFRVQDYPEATYAWSFPEGVSLLQGQGSSEVTVNWGEQGGTVTVEQNYQSSSYTSTLEVTTIQVPAGDTLIIRGNEELLGTWKTSPGEDNTIVLDYEE